MNQEKPEYKLFDAKGQILGRFAVKIAKYLAGKNEIDFTPNIGGNGWAIVINSDKVRLSAEKAKKKIYWHHTGFPGGIKSATFEEMMAKDSTKVIQKAVKGMMPKNKLSAAAEKRLRIFKDENHTYAKQLEESSKQ
jgi:large subunit ribosomal protein L13